jgi:hypothetical protein
MEDLLINALFKMAVQRRNSGECVSAADLCGVRLHAIDFSLIGRLFLEINKELYLV